MIVGRRLEALPAHAGDVRARASAVTIEGLSGGTLEDVSIALRAGEIVGLTGLIGSGFDEVPYLVFGARPASAGRLTLGAARHDLRAMTPAAAMRARIVLIPGDRANAGAIASLTVADNVTMPVLGSAFRRWFLNRRGLLARAARLGEAYDVTPNQPALPFAALSGGNQQKVLLAKWLQVEPLLVLLDEPTQGVDVGARQKVFKAIGEVGQGGAAVLCASSDYEQLATICDRVLIFSHGRILGELSGAAVTKETIAERCYQSADGAMAATAGGWGA